MKVVKTLLMLGLGFGGTWAMADTPLTECDINVAYVEACSKQKLPDRICKALAAAQNSQADFAFLADDSVALDQRLAVVNALGWSGGDQAAAFAKYVNDNNIAMTPSLEMIHGYKLALETKKQLVRRTDLSALDAVTKAAVLLPNVFSAQVIRSLVYAQTLVLQPNSNEIWIDYDKVRKAFPLDKRDLLPAAVEIVTNYLELYE